MSKVQSVRGFINQRLSAAAEEIFELFEKTIAVYEEQLRRSKENQQKLLDAVYNPVRLHRADVQQLLVSPGSVPGQKQDRGFSLVQRDLPEPPHIKEEEEDLWSLQETEQLHGLKEEETTEFLLTPVPAQTEEEEEPQSSQLHVNQTEVMLDFDSETDDSSFCLERLTPLSFSESASSSDQKEPEGEARKTQNNGKTFSCSVCGKCYIKQSSLFKHQKTHIGNVQHVSGLNPLQNLETPVSDVTCDTGRNLESSSDCASSSEQQKEPQDPKETLQKDKPFCCSFCDKRFISRSQLARHETCHSTEKPFCCSVCGKRFPQERYLKGHMLCHSGEKPYICSICGKRFLRPSRLKEHESNHTGEKPHPCSVCGKTFPNQRYLKCHMICHSTEKPYGCSVCGKRFLRAARLKEHETIHTGGPYVCSVCGKVFVQIRYLKDHMRCHSTEKPHGCSFCGKRFLKPSRLREHVSKHTGEKPFRCSVCGKGFTRPDVLKKHVCKADRSRNK